MSKELKHILIVVAVVCCAAFLRCANQLAPQGGPKDSLPPVVKIATPDFGKRHFNEKRIFIEFNEYIQLKDQNKEFFTSPLMSIKPTLSIRERGVRIDIKDTLLKNQTYALNFGTSVRDNNEGNIHYGLRYVFSTGSAIDSMLMTGYTADAMKGDRSPRRSSISSTRPLSIPFSFREPLPFSILSFPIRLPLPSIRSTLKGSISNFPLPTPCP